MTPTYLKALRTSLGLTQAQLADRLGVKPNTVYRWEVGLRKIPEMAERLLRSLA